MTGVLVSDHDASTTPVAPEDLTAAWFVCTPHRTSLARPHQPFGLRHAQRAGGKFTACGIPTLGWATFWVERFRVGSDATCSQCSSAIVADMRRAANGARLAKSPGVHFHL